jgi:hypothetical protein
MGSILSAWRKKKTNKIKVYVHGGEPGTYRKFKEKYT